MKYKIPTYTVCGFIDSGKTSFINSNLNQNLNYGIIQFEIGDVAIINSNNIRVLQIPTRNILDNIEKTKDDIQEFLYTHSFDILWIEANGIMDFSILETIFYSEKIKKILNFKNTFYICDDKTKSILASGNNENIIEQIINSDVAICNDENFNILKSVNTNIVRFKNTKLSKIQSKNKIQIITLVVALFIAVNIYLTSTNFIPENIFPIKSVLLILKGIIFQSFPFLLLGVVISSLIQIFIPNSFLEKYFPKDPFLGIIFATCIGFIFPVCDCASIPVFRGLVKKNIPLPAAIAFMIATPIINPIVVLSTYSAFSDISFVLLRCGLGLIIALLVGLFFHLVPSKNILNYANLNIDCKSYSSNKDSNLIKFFKHAQGEFLNVAKYLILGALISATIQVYISNINWQNSTSTKVGSLIIMMIAGFLLSLCSSSDAIVVKSFSANMPLIALLGFLTFGAMIDIKNVILLANSFKKRFIIKLVLVITLISFLTLSLLTII